MPRASKPIPLPPEYEFLRRVRLLTAAEARELNALAQRGETLAKRGNYQGRLGEVVPASIREDLSQLYRDLEGFGRKYGLIGDPAPVLPAKPLAALREAIRLQRLALDRLRGQDAVHQGGIDALWDLWRKSLPDQAPPSRPVVGTWHETQDALDLAQRELGLLEAARTAPPETPPLRGAAKAALAIIQARKGRGLPAKEIIGELKRQGIVLEDSTFRRHIVPQLKAVGVENDRARGGYYYTTCLGSM